MMRFLMGFSAVPEAGVVVGEREDFSEGIPFKNIPMVSGKTRALPAISFWSPLKRSGERKKRYSCSEAGKLKGWE